jgi:hypothetical protein
VCSSDLPGTSTWQDPNAHTKAKSKKDKSK